MTSLCLAVAVAAGADPLPAADCAPCGPRIAEKRLPSVLHPYERMKAKVADLALPGAGKPMPCGSFIWQQSYEIDFCLRGPARPYTPQPGDIVLSTDTSSFWKYMHNLAGTSHPTHSMLVFAFPDGSLGILEGGPHDTLKCRTLEALPHMLTYENEGRVWVRRRAVPLTPEESARLTEFALAADGKQFSIRKLALQLTPLRARGPIRTALVGQPRGLEKPGYFCSELLVEALVYAGLLDPCTARPAATYPRDLFLDRSPNPYLNRHLKLAPAWEPPARWTSSDNPLCQPQQSRGQDRWR